VCKVIKIAPKQLIMNDNYDIT